MERGPLQDLAFRYSPAIILVTLLTILSLIDSRIIAFSNLLIVIVQATPIAVLALGAFLVLVTAGIDLSAGAVVTLCAVVTGVVLLEDASLPLALLAGFTVAIAFGAINGVLVGYIGVPPFVATLATMIIAQGFTLIAATRGVLLVSNDWLREFGLGTITGIPILVAATVVVAVALNTVMRSTRLGLYTYAIGSNAESAVLAGLRLRKQLFVTYVLAAAFYFLAAVFIVSRIPVITPNVGGTGILLDGIAAAVIGGTSIYGGKGSVPGVIVGALIVSLLTNALRVLGVDPSSIQLYKGLIIAAALILDSLLNQAYKRSEHHE